MEKLIERFLIAFATVIARLGFPASAQQLAIFAWFAYGNGNLVVRARAGTGKTTTIMAALNFAKDRNILIAAFSRDIADELAARVKKLHTTSKVDARSLHSLGNGLIWYYLAGGRKGSTEIDTSRGRRLARRALEEHVIRVYGKKANIDVPREIITLVSRLASLGKNCAPFGKPSDLTALAYSHKVLPEPEAEKDGWKLDVIAACAVRAMEIACEKETNDAGQIVYDYDDQIFLPVRLNFARPKYDLVIIDEAQDMNYTQLLLAQRVASGRIVVVGDDRQAIYGFRGADSNSIDRLKSELNAAELPLTVTYRCGRKIVERARELVRDYEAAPNAHDGEIVAGATWDTVYSDAAPGDFVLSRNNAQVTKICLRLLRLGKPAFIRGRDIGDNLRAVIESINAETIPGLIEGLKLWTNRQIQIAAAKLGPDDELDERVIEGITDTSDTIEALVQDVATIRELHSKIDSLFTNAKGGAATICCSTVHRSKGLEADRVFLLVDTLRYGDIEERNIAYVGITRAKKILVEVKGK